ncbi:MAG: carboxymuconolactone decarboxylase family protein [Caldilineaceae bacterium]|nr:carboxymuconolactone decarboxylase family protein [Caldilineaceae bacterium]
MSDNQALSTKQQSIIPISAFTATGDLTKLKPALQAGLEAGLTVNEIKEILVHLYAYAGFPRSLNGINTFMALLDERQAQGIEDEVGPDADPVPADMDRDDYGARVRAKLAGAETIPPPSGYQLFVPIIDTFLKEHLFADIFARDVLDFQTRELVTISALASMLGTGGQLLFHLGAAMNTGLSEAQLQGFIVVLANEVGQQEAAAAAAALGMVLSRRAS